MNSADLTSKSKVFNKSLNLDKEVILLFITKVVIDITIRRKYIGK